MNVVIVGGGVTGLALALTLHEQGIPCRVHEAAPEFKPLGVGISLKANGMERLGKLGLAAAVAQKAVPCEQVGYFNRFGQLIYYDHSGEHTQFMIHRADLHTVLLDAVEDRLGPDAVVLGRQCVGVEQDEDSATARFADGAGGEGGDARGDIVVACDGIGSAVRRQFYPEEGDPVWSGVNLWRGVTVHPPFLGGRTQTMIGELDTGKMVVYPIRDDVDDQGNQLINWVAEVREPTAAPVGWNVTADPDAVAARFAGWNFDWLDVEALMRDGDPVFQYPMSDRDPIDKWAFGRVLLMGDAAHPMVPRAGNGAMQGIIDAAVLAEGLARGGDPRQTLASFEADRLSHVNEIVLAARSSSPDIVMEVVRDRVGDRPFERREDVVSDAEIEEILAKFRTLTAERA